jgi:3-dehydroquinate dehydratase II
MRRTIYVFNGPNLNLLGQREPEIYGRDTLGQVEARCRALTDAHGLGLDFRQTNAEHEMVAWFQEVRAGAVGVVFNPAAFTYAAYPVLDAIKMVDSPVVEVHISNIHRREAEWRSRSIMTQVVTGMISGLGVHGYELAVMHLIRHGRVSAAEHSR